MRVASVQMPILNLPPVHIRAGTSYSLDSVHVVLALLTGERFSEGFFPGSAPPFFLHVSPSLTGFPRGYVSMMQVSSSA